MTAIIEIYANNAKSILSSAVTSSATTFYINSSDAALFPTPVAGTEFFRLRLTDALAPNSVEEIVYVTTRSGNTLTVIRGQEGTTAQAWAVNTPCWNAATAGTYYQFMQHYYGVNSSGINFYTVATQTYGHAYYDGMLVEFLPLLANTITNPTLNVNGLGAVVITNSDGSTILAGQLPAYSIVACVYNSAGPRWELTSRDGVSVTPPTSDNSTKIATTEFVRNYASSTQGVIPSGSRVVFAQAAAPVGWTQVTTYNDYALRIVNTAGGDTGGTVDFSVAFSNRSISGTIGGTALTVDQLPGHTHSGTTGGDYPPHMHTMTWYVERVPIAAKDNNVVGDENAGYGEITGGTSFPLQQHQHNFTTSSTGSGNTHTHTLSGASVNLAVKYLNTIICSKD